MLKKLKVLSYYFVMLFLSLLVLGLSLVSFTKVFFLKSDYIINHLREINYYDDLTDSIKTEMSNYIIQSGLVDSVLDNIYTKELVQETLEGAINDLYNGKRIGVDTSKVKENLNKNINEYLGKHNIIITDQKALDMFMDQMLSVYTDEIIISTKVNKVQSLFLKVVDLINKLFIVLVLLTILVSIFSLVFYRRNFITIPTISSAILILLGNYLFFNKVDVASILFWNNNVSKVIRSVFFDVSSKLNTFAIILIVIGLLSLVVFSIIEYFKNNKKEEIKVEVKNEKEEVKIVKEEVKKVSNNSKKKKSNKKKKK